MALSNDPQTLLKPAGENEFGRIAAGLARWMSILGVFAFSAATVVVVALAAPVALGVSAAVRAAAPARRRGRWRLAQPA